MRNPLSAWIWIAFAEPFRVRVQIEGTERPAPSPLLGADVYETARRLQGIPAPWAASTGRGAGSVAPVGSGISSAVSEVKHCRHHIQTPPSGAGGQDDD